MDAEDRPEVNLEISSGFFRIPTDRLVYNITVIGEPTGIKIIEKIVEKEKENTRLDMADSAGKVDSPYCNELYSLLLSDVSQACSCSYSVAERIASKIDAGFPPLILRAQENIKKIVSSSQEMLGGGLDSDRSLALAQPNADELASVRESIASLHDRINDAIIMLSPLLQLAETADSDPSEQDLLALFDAKDSTPAAAPARYLFNMDVVFQTLYELCTNETVKTHITTARHNAEAYFSRDTFLDLLNTKIAGLEADADNFFNVPMSDVLYSLLNSCNEKPIQNLLKKMDANQGGIFLDGVLPLEVPPREEIPTTVPDVSSHEAAKPAAPAIESTPDQRLFELNNVLRILRDEAGALGAAMAAFDGVASEEGREATRPRSMPAGLERLAELARAADGDVAALREWEREFSRNTSADTVELCRQWVILALALREQIHEKERDPRVTAGKSRERAWRDAAAKANRAGSIKELASLL